MNRSFLPKSAVRAGQLSLITLVLVTQLSGCGWLRPDQPVYVSSEELPPIEVPEDLSEPELRTVFEIPGFAVPQLAAQGDEAMPPRVPTSAEAEVANSRIRFGATGLYLEVDDEAASVWRRLGFALNRGDLSVQQVLQDQRRYRFELRHEPIVVDERGWMGRIFLFWRDPEVINYSGTYLAEVQPESSGRTRVAILDQEGQILIMNRAEFVLAQLRDRLG
ncbi:MAG: hypothetical protein AAF446_01840 [Pseudomonadota bacterium]